MICESDKKVVAVIYADLECSALGTRGRLAECLAGQPVLTRTVRRLEQADGLDEIVVLCPDSQRLAVQELVAGSEVVVEGLHDAVELSSSLPRRKWALESWRGGLGEAMQFDEHQFTKEMIDVLRGKSVHSVVLVPGEAVLVDPELVAGLVAHHHEAGNVMRFTFTQAAPGLVGCAFRLDLLGELEEAGVHVGNLLAYSPTEPRSDYVNDQCAYRIAQEFCTSPFRFLADTQRSFTALETVLERLGDDDYDTAAAVRAMEDIREHVDYLPRELEVEINTEPSLRMKGYPHGQLKNRRGAMSLAQFRKIVGDCDGYDDVCLTIGGIGEPLVHKELVAMVQAAKQAGIFGINIETDGRALTQELSDRLLQEEIDTITVYLDADSSDGYKQAKGQDCFEQVVGQMEEFIEKSSKMPGGGPLIVPCMVKTRTTMAEMEGFYDRWRQRCGAAVIEGFNSFAGQIADEAVMDMSPPKRWACGRLFRRMSILADGTVTMCGQDYDRRCVVGNVFEQSVGAIWRGEKMEQLRRAHIERQFDVNELCEPCKEWHR